MNYYTINLKNAKVMKLEGRQMYMLITPDTIKSENISMVLIRVEHGETVRPCHSHPTSEEIIYIIKGKGKAWVNGEIFIFIKESAVFIPMGSKHMIKNIGRSVLEAICVFSPPVTPESYNLYRNIEFE